MNAAVLEQLCFGESLYIYFKVNVGSLNRSSFWLKKKVPTLSCMYVCVCVCPGGGYRGVIWREEGKTKHGQ